MLKKIWRYRSRRQRRAQVLGKVKLDMYFNDGNRGTGTATDMALSERQTLVSDGIVVASIDVARQLPRNVSASTPADEIMANSRLRAKVQLTTRGMWQDNGRLLRDLHEACNSACDRLAPDARCAALKCSHCVGVFSDSEFWPLHFSHCILYWSLRFSHCIIQIQNFSPPSFISIISETVHCM